MGLLGRWFNSGRERPPGPRPSQDSVTEREEILHVLRSLVKGHKLVTVRLPGSDQTFSSTLLELDPRGGTLLMDELNPKAGHALIADVREFKLDTRVSGTDIAFAGRVAAIDTSGKIAAYRVPLPTRVGVHQRRAAFRADVDLGAHIPVYLETLDHASVTAELRDVSLGGLGLEIRRRPVNPLEAGQRLPSCTIQVPEGEPIRVQIEVRFIGRMRNAPTLRMGARFVDPSPQCRRAIRQLVAALDRKRAKNHRTYELP